MKRFEFPLSRVLDWRRTQVQIEESKLQRLHTELRGIETRLAEIRLARKQSGQSLLTGGAVTGAELAALDSFKKASALECNKLSESAGGARKRIAAQLQIVIQRRGAVKLLELLHTRKLEAWNTELSREIDREAAELHLAKFAREQSG